jgi:hypothetical protein
MALILGAGALLGADIATRLQNPNEYLIHRRHYGDDFERHYGPYLEPGQPWHDYHQIWRAGENHGRSGGNMYYDGQGRR